MSDPVGSGDRWPPGGAEAGPAASVLEHLPGIAYLCDPDGNFTLRFVSGAVNQLLGVSADDLVGVDFAQFIHPDDLDEVHRDVALTLDSGKPYDLRYRIVRPDGEERWVWGQGGLATDVGLLEGLLLDVTDRVHAEREVRALEFRYRSLIENLDESVVLVSEGVVVYANAATAQLLRSGPLPVTGRIVADLLHPDEVARSAVDRDTVNAQRPRVVRRNYRIKADDGEILEVTADVTAVQLQGRDHLQIVIRDMSAARRATRFRKGVDDLLARAVAGRTVEYSLRHLAELTEQRLPTRRCVIARVRQGRLSVVAAPSLRPDVAALLDDGLLAAMPWLERAIRTGQVATGLRVRPRVGGAASTTRGWAAAAKARTSRDVDVVVLVLGNEFHPAIAIDSEIVHEVRNVAATIVEQDARREELDASTLTDPLTGLPSRAAVVEGVRRALEDGLDSRVTVLLVNIDGLHLIDESLGHGAGDTLVRQVGERLTGAAGPETLVGRVVDGRFAVVCPGLGDPLRIDERILALRASVADLTVDEHRLAITLSVGVASSRPGHSADDLLSEAIGALDQARSAGTNATAWFDEASRMRARRRLETEIALRHALDEGEIAPHYQPRVRLADGVVVGAEALARWERPGVGTVLPKDFIGLAEEVALIQDIDRTILRQACHDAARWVGAGADMDVSVNVSGHQFTDPGLVDVVAAALEDSGLMPARLVLEVTESTMLHGLDQSRAMLDAIRATGVRIAIDDFGTGYSSLAYLKQFPFDELKIDRSFVIDLPTPHDRALVEAMCVVAGALGLAIVAEGVETLIQRDTLVELGCPAAQGFLWSPAVPASAFDELLVTGFGAGP